MTKDNDNSKEAEPKRDETTPPEPIEPTKVEENLPSTQPESVEKAVEKAPEEPVATEQVIEDPATETVDLGPKPEDTGAAETTSVEENPAPSVENTTTAETQTEPSPQPDPATQTDAVKPAETTPEPALQEAITKLDELDTAAKVKLAEKKEKKDKKDKGEKTSLPPIIKKVKKHGHGHHGGSWKIAFADFVTAMMAFFLLMWLVASLNKAQKAGIAEYFRQPIKVAISGGEGMGNRQVNVKGGGPNVEDVDGQVSASNKPLITDKIDAEKELVESKKEEVKMLEQLKSEINLSMEKDPALAGLKKQLLMDVVSDGLRIQLIDNQNKPMFDVGSDKVNPAIMPILANIAKLLNSVKNKVTIQGHTDANPYHNPEELDYTNWELSSQRANAARRALIKAGMDENKVMTVSGFASTVLMDKKNPYNPENRRISIIVMKKGAEEKINTNK